MSNKTIVANTDFMCPICGGTEKQYEEGHLIVYSALNSPYDLKMITVSLCAKCADGAFNAIQKNIQQDKFKIEYYC